MLGCEGAEEEREESTMPCAWSTRTDAWRALVYADEKKEELIKFWLKRVTKEWEIDLEDIPADIKNTVQVRAGRPCSTACPARSVVRIRFVL
jgi:hypothetical protein